MNIFPEIFIKWEVGFGAQNKEINKIKKERKRKKRKEPKNKKNKQKNNNNNKQHPKKKICTSGFEPLTFGFAALRLTNWL